MALSDAVKISEIKCVGDIDDFFELNVLDEISDDEELDEYISQLTNLGKSYRDIHTDLSVVLGDTEYEAQYPKATFDAKRKNMNESIQNAKRKLRSAKRTKKLGVTKSRATEKVNDLLSEKMFLIHQSNEFVKKFDALESLVELPGEEYTPSDMDDLKHDISLLENHLADLQRLKFKIENILEDSESHTDELSKFEEMVKSKILTIRKKYTDSRNFHEEQSRNSFEEENLRIKSANEASLKEEHLVVKYQFKEIEIRCESLMSKVDGNAIPDMTGHQLTEAEKCLFDLDRDFGEILEKITHFVDKFSGYCGEVDSLTAMMDKVSASKSKYFQQIKKEISSRDISEEKLKTALSLNLKLPAFSGYDSQLDIFSFKRDFGKLVEPYLSKIHWADSLKRKYLTGSALTLVKSIEDIDKIWEKLQSTYGDVQLLLQNKLLSLDKIGNLWEVKSDEQRITAISSLLNSMTELSSLAKEHSLENELFYGGGVEKVLSIMGDDRKRKFVRKSEVRLKGPQAWLKIREMLEKELSECEKLALFEKTEQLFAIKIPKKNPPGKPPLPKITPVKNLQTTDSGSGDVSNGGSFAVVSADQCHICDESSNHVLTIRGDRKFVQYFTCKKFVEKKCSERLKILTDKNLCPKCLRPGIKKGHKGVCYKQYLCPNSSHTPGNKVHVLVCGDHCSDQQNHILVEKYKTEVMAKLTPDMASFSKEIKICNFNLPASVFSADAAPKASTVPRSKKDGPSLFATQKICIEGHVFNLFYDSGGGDMVIKGSAAEKLRQLGRATLEVPPPLRLFGVGGTEIVSKYGIFEVRLPLRKPTVDGDVDAFLSGMCLERVTNEFPDVSLKTVKGEFKQQWEILGNTEPLPDIPDCVGGEVDILIGNQYLEVLSKGNPTV